MVKNSGKDVEGMNVEEAVLTAHTKLMKSKGIERESSRELEIRRRNGIDSMGIVTLILDVEDILELELDGCLGDIRRSKTIGDIIDVIENFVNK